MSQVFFALNRALIFKWIWRFISHDSSLWARFIQAIYGIKGALDISHNIPKRSSLWLDIIHEVKHLSHKGIDICSFLKKKKKLVMVNALNFGKIVGSVMSL